MLTKEEIKEIQIILCDAVIKERKNNQERRAKHLSDLERKIGRLLIDYDFIKLGEE